MTYVRALLIVFWLSSPAIFLFFHVRGQRASSNLRGGNARSWFATSTLAINWILFVVLLVRSVMPNSTIVFPISMLTHILLGLSLVGVVLGVRKWPLLMANVALASLWIVIAYAPAHWLRNVGPGNVRVDGKRIGATVFFGRPTDSEAEELAMVEIPGIGDYFLSFGEEKVKPAIRSEYLRLPYGIWVLNSLREMSLVEPLPPTSVNQFRIASPDGRVIEVQF